MIVSQGRAGRPKDKIATTEEVQALSPRRMRTRKRQDSESEPAGDADDEGSNIKDQPSPVKRIRHEPAEVNAARAAPVKNRPSKREGTDLGSLLNGPFKSEVWQAISLLQAQKKDPQVRYSTLITFLWY